MDGDQSRSPDRTEIDAGKLWAGGVATAIVAALVAIVGLLVARGVLDIAVLVARSEVRGTPPRPHRMQRWRLSGRSSPRP